MPKFSKGEILCVTHKTENGQTYFITRKKDDLHCYIIYKEETKTTIKLGKGQNPLELERKYIT